MPQGLNFPFPKKPFITEFGLRISVYKFFHYVYIGKSSKTFYCYDFYVHTHGVD
jgi:hypothetical protein